MHISLSQVGRRFNKEWIFKEIDYEFQSGGRYAILGPNGSGKSTLISILMGTLSPSAGKISYVDGVEIRHENIYKYLSFAAPYLDLIEEFTLEETLSFHFSFKCYAPGMDQEKLLALLGLSRSQDKPLKYFSSGMKQRTKLALACCSDTPLLFLDEPTSNLDSQGIDWYKQLIDEFGLQKTIIIGSNQQHEYEFCKHHLSISDYK